LSVMAGDQSHVGTRDSLLFVRLMLDQKECQRGAAWISLEEEKQTSEERQEGTEAQSHDEKCIPLLRACVPACLRACVPACLFFTP
jgi:ferredoxin